MEISLETFSEHEKVRFGASASGTCLLVTENEQGDYALSVLRGELDGSQHQPDYSVTIESSSVAKLLRRAAVLDPRAKYIFGSSADQKTLIVLSIAKTVRRVTATHTVHDLQFEGNLFALKSLGNANMYAHSKDSSGIVAAVSVLGELTLLSASGSSPEVQQRRLTVPQVDKVVFVTTYEHDHLIVVALRKTRLLFYAVRLPQEKIFTSMKVEILPEVDLPNAPSSSPVINAQDGVMGFAIQEDCAMISYADGYVHIIEPGRELTTSRRGSFTSNWFSSDSDNSKPRSVRSTKLRHAMRLSRGGSVDSATALKKWRSLPDERDGVVALGSGFFAVAFGEYISVWDGIYCVGHSFTKAPSYVDFLFTDSSSNRIFAVSGGAAYRLRFGEIERPTVLTLSTAMKNKGACDAIVTDIQQNIERAPLHSQPVTVRPLQAAAESGGQIETIFRRLIDIEEESEVKQIRALLSRDAIPSADALISTIQPYFKIKRGIRRGESGSAKDLGLAKLPSERLAAVAVARCVFEIACGNRSYVVPFIDMLGVGVVSSEAVVSVLGVADSWDMGPETRSLDLTSICDPLLSSDSYMNALEAVLIRVADLPERDILKVFRFTVQCILREGSTNESTSLKRWQLERLLLRSMAYRVQPGRLIEVMRKLPFSDVTACIAILQEMLKRGEKLMEGRKSEVPRFIRTGQFVKNGVRNEHACLYRGLGNWVDKDYEEQQQKRTIDETEICVRWVSYLIDAHLSAMIMDENAQQMATRMLDLVRECRKESEALKSVEGLVSHLADRHGVPGCDQEDLYKVSHHEVPMSLALE